MPTTEETAKVHVFMETLSASIVTETPSYTVSRYLVDMETSEISSNWAG